MPEFKLYFQQVDFEYIHECCTLYKMLGTVECLFKADNISSFISTYHIKLKLIKIVKKNSYLYN